MQRNYREYNLLTVDDVIQDWGYAYGYYIGTAIHCSLEYGITADAQKRLELLSTALHYTEQALTQQVMKAKSHSRISARFAAEDFNLDAETIELLTYLRSGSLREAAAVLKAMIKGL